MPTQAHNFGAAVAGGAVITLPLNNAIWTWKLGARYSGTVTIFAFSTDPPGTTFVRALVDMLGFDAHWRVSYTGTNYSINSVSYDYDMTVTTDEPQLSFNLVPFPDDASVNCIVTRND
jgi:hypothetical protein